MAFWSIYRFIVVISFSFSTKSGHLIRTTMNIYGDAQSAEMRKANGQIVELAFSLQ